MTSNAKCGVCTDFRTLRKKMDSDSTGTEVDPYRPYACPPDSSELGRSTWTFLHSMAAYYPETPSQQDKADMAGFIKSLARFYPCWYCAEHFSQYISATPPLLDSNSDLSLWFCDAHNEVNQRLGKKQFDCSTVLERWKYGMNKCWQ